MSISIKQRYKPFTHTPGAKVLLPGTSDSYQIYPTTFKPDGIEGFTLMLDLEKGEIAVLGKGFKHKIVNPKKAELERLSFGVHKKQEWEGIVKRSSVEEFLPIWYHLSQWYEPQDRPPPNSLLESCMQEVDKIALTKKLEQLFKSGFSNLFFPESNDVKHQGFPKEPLGEAYDPTLLFSVGRTLIRSLFFKKEGEIFSFLPLVPKGIHCGRFLNIREDGVRLDFEWTKHLPRRVVLEAGKECTIQFAFPKEIQEFRIKSVNKRFSNFSKITLLPGRYLFDQFKK